MCSVVTTSAVTTKSIGTAASTIPHPWPAACYIGLEDHGTEKVRKFSNEENKVPNEAGIEVFPLRLSLLTRVLYQLNYVAVYLES